MRARVVQVVPRGEARPATAESAGAFELSAELAERLRARDEGAYAELFRIAFTPLAQFAYRYLPSYEAAEDVVQDVMCRLWSLGPAWSHHGSPRAYLYSAVRNGAINALRHRAVAARHEADVLQEIAADPALAVSAVPESDSVLLEQLHRMLAQLTDRQRAAFELRYTRGLTVPEVAVVLGLSVKGAEKLFARTLHALRAKLTPLR